MSLNSITNIIAESALESGAEGAVEAAKEEQCRISICMREKIDKVLEKTEGALEKVQKVTSKVEKLNPLTQKIEQATTSIRSKRTKNKEKIQTEKEAGAWSTLGRIYNGSMAKVKAGTAVVTGIASKIPDALRFKNAARQEVRSASRFSPLGLFKGITMPKLPDLSVPEMQVQLPEMRLLSLPMPRFPDVDPLDLSPPDVSLFGWREMSMPRIEASLPKVPSLPSLPPAITDKVVEKVQEKVWEKVDEQVDRAMTSAEEYVTDPVKRGQKSVEDLVEHYTGKQGVESMEAVKLIFNHHTAEYQEKASGCFGRVKDRVKQLPHWIAGGCYSLFCGSAPTEPQPVTV